VNHTAVSSLSAERGQTVHSGEAELVAVVKTLCGTRCGFDASSENGRGLRVDVGAKTLGSASRTTLALLSWGRDLRWLVPLGDRGCEREALRMYRPYRPAARALKGLLQANIVAGTLAPLWRRRLEIAHGNELSLQRLVREVTGHRDALFAFSIGTPGAFQKLCIQVMRPGGEIIGYIKAPVRPGAAQRIRHEAEVLDGLRQWPALRSIVPRLLFADEWEGDYLLFETAGPTATGPTRYGAAHKRFLEILEQKSAATIPGTQLVQRLRREAVNWTAPFAGLAERVLDLAQRHLAGVEVQCGLIHGDFAPWNTRMEGDRLFVFDWESAEAGLPLAWDAFHFHVQLACLLGKRLTRPLPMEDGIEGHALLLLYLLSSCQRLQAEAGPQHDVDFRQRMLAVEIGRQRPASK
jgi:hypothetical protein